MNKYDAISCATTERGSAPTRALSRKCGAKSSDAARVTCGDCLRSARRSARRSWTGAGPAGEARPSAQEIETRGRGDARQSPRLGPNPLWRSHAFTWPSRKSLAESALPVDALTPARGGRTGKGDEAMGSVFWMMSVHAAKTASCGERG